MVERAVYFFLSWVWLFNASAELGASFGWWEVVALAHWQIALQHFFIAGVFLSFWLAAERSKERGDG